MKKVSSIFLIMAFLCGLFFVPAKAISVNHCKAFEQAFYELQWYISHDNNSTKENEQFPIDAILDYTYSNCHFSSEYGIGEIGDLGYETYAFPANYFESLAKKFFSIVNIEDLRNSGATSFYGVKFDPQTKEYIGCNPSGWGGCDSYKIYGYAENGENKYTTYGYLGPRMSEKDFSETETPIGYIYTGGVMADGSKEILAVSSYLKSVVSYNDNIVKFHSLETIYALPEKSGLITADTKVDTPVSSTPSNKQTSTPQQTTSSQNKSPSSSASQNQSNDKTSSGLVSKQETTQSQQTASNQNKLPSSSEAQSQSNDKTSSSLVSKQETTQSQQIASNQNKFSGSSETQSQSNNKTPSSLASTQETIQSNGSKDNTEIKTKNIVLITVIILATTLIVGVVIVYFFMLKKKTQR